MEIEHNMPAGLFIKNIYNNYKDHWLVKLVFTILLIGIMATIFDSVLGGVIGYMGYVIVWSLFIYIRQRKAFNQQWLMLVRQIETLIWGKPMEKEYWNKNELAKKRNKTSDKRVRDRKKN